MDSYGKPFGSKIRSTITLPYCAICLRYCDNMLTLLQYAYVIAICLPYYNMLTLLQYAYVIAICLHYYNILTLLQYAYVIANLTAWCASRRINVVSARSVS